MVRVFRGLSILIRRFQGHQSFPKLLFNFKQFCFGLAALIFTVLLYGQGLFNGADEVLVDFFEGFYFYNAAFVFAGSLNGTLLEHLCILAEQVVGGLGNFFLQLQGFVLPEDADGDDDLIFPKGDGVEQTALDLFDQQLVVVLYQADLWCGLQCDGATQTQVVDFFLEAVHQLFVVVQLLNLCAIARLGGCLFHLGQFALPDGLQFEFSGGDVNFQIAQILQVFVVQGIEHSHVFQQLHFSLVELVADAVDVGADFFVALDEALQRDEESTNKWQGFATQLVGF